MITRRAYQTEGLRVFAEKKIRNFALLYERQAGKSTELADMSLLEMMEAPGRSVIYASASLLLGTEITLKQELRIQDSVDDILEREAGVIAERMAMPASDDFRMATVDVKTRKEVKDLKADDLTDLFAKQRLEFRVYHDRGRYSRTKVIAPNVATARSWAGTVILDEIAFIRDLKELITAVLPIISTKKNFRIIYSTTPPEFNDTHYSFEMLAPEQGQEFKVNAKGNWYESRGNISVHRVDAYDSYAAGKKIYDIKSGKEITPDEAFARALDKDGHRIAHFLAWLAGGSAACDAQRLAFAQERGAAEGCATFEIRSDSEFRRALTWLADHIHPMRPIALGFDVATTNKKKSNPSVLATGEDGSPDTIIRQFLIWKTKDPEVARERIKAVLKVIAARPGGGRARALAVDATSEKLFAEDLKKQLRKEVPVMLVVASEAVKKPGLQKPTNWKEYAGSQYVGKMDDSHLSLPPEKYVYEDHRLVLRDGSRFVCEPDEQGRHGDTFDAGKLVEVGLTGPTGGIQNPSKIRAMGMANTKEEEASLA